MVILLAMLLLSLGTIRAQTAAPATAVAMTSADHSAIEQLRPALEQIGPALDQARIDHWKLSRTWKDQLRGDADSIRQDLTSQLPALFAEARQAPGTLAPQLAVTHNVDALYDVLVRISTAANLAGNKKEAVLLVDAVQRLEAARRAASNQLMQTAAMQDRQIAHFQADIRAAKETEARPKTIIVNNTDAHPRRHHRRFVPHKKSVPKTRPSTVPPAAAHPG